MSQTLAHGRNPCGAVPIYGVGTRESRLSGDGSAMESSGSPFAEHFSQPSAP